MALAGTIFYMVHHILVIVSLFLVSGLIARAGGSYFKAQLGGLYGTRPLLALLFLVPALSLSGVPPLSGFWAKLSLLRVTLERELWLAAAIALLVGLLTLFSMVASG